MTNDEEKFLLKLGKKIELLANEKYTSQIQFALACDIDARTIRRIYKAEQNPTILVLRKISLALEIDLQELIKIDLD